MTVDNSVEAVDARLMRLIRATTTAREVRSLAIKHVRAILTVLGDTAALARLDSLVR